MDWGDFLIRIDTDLYGIFISCGFGFFISRGFGGFGKIFVYLCEKLIPDDNEKIPYRGSGL